MHDVFLRTWPNAADELSAKNLTREPVSLLYRDEWLDFFVNQVTWRKSGGFYIQLVRSGTIATILTRPTSDDVEISFYSKG